MHLKPKNVSVATLTQNNSVTAWRPRWEQETDQSLLVMANIYDRYFSLNIFPAAGSTVSSVLCHARGVVALGETPTSLRFGSAIFLIKVASQPVMTTAWDRCKAPRAARGGCLLAEL